MHQLWGELDRRLLIKLGTAGLAALDVHTLSENRAAVSLVHALGASWKSESAGVAEYVLDVGRALAALRADTDARGVQDVLAQLGA